MALARITRFPLFRDIDELFRDFAMPTRFEGAVEAHAFVPNADVIDHEKAIEIQLELPGVKPEEIDVKLEGTVLTVAVDRVMPKMEEKTSYIRQERIYGRCERAFTLPAELAGTQVEATYKNGVLFLTLPKREEVLPKTVKVNVAA